MKWKESIKTVTVNLLAHPVGSVFPIFKKAEIQEARRQNSDCHPKEATLMIDYLFRGNKYLQFFVKNTS